MVGQSNETQSEPDDLRPQLVARAVARANSARQAIDKIASLDAEIVQGVLERTPAEVRDLHVDNIFESGATAGDLAKGIDHVFANLTRMAAEIRLRDASDDTARTRIILLLDDIQILHRQLNLLQKFLLASDLLSELARSAYAIKYRSANSVRGAATTESEDGRADKPAASDAPADTRQSAARDMIVTCRNCAKQFTAPESLAGKQVRCLNCQQPLSVPPLSSSPSGKRPAAKSAAAGFRSTLQKAR